MFSSRMALFLLLLPASMARADETENKAIGFVVAAGGQVELDETAAGKPVVYVTSNSAKVTDAGLKELAVLKQLARWTSATRN